MSAAAVAVLLGAGMGALAGSLLATLVVRWPEDRSIAAGRSACDGCGAIIPPHRLVPLAGYLMQRGRAACCGAAIDPVHPLVEAACALVGGAALALRPDAGGVAGALLGWLLVALAALDLRHLWLPDRLTGTLAALGLAGGIAGLAPPLPDRLAGGLGAWAALALLAAAYRAGRGREGLGRGDAKLLGAIGLWLGWRPLPWVVLAACAIGLVWVAARAIAGRPVGRAEPLPLGAMLAAAAWGAWAWGAVWPGIG